MFVSLFSLALGRLKSLFRAIYRLYNQSSLYMYGSRASVCLRLCKCTEALFLLPDYS